MRAGRFSLSLLALLAAAGVAACGQLPQPFSRDAVEKAASPPPLVQASEGVVVLPVAGVPDETGALIAALTAAALRDQGIVAAPAIGNRASLVLATYGSRQADGSMLLEWTLARPDGSMVGEFSRSVSSDDELLAATQTLVGWIDPRVGLEPDPGFRPRITVIGVDGAPGDGNRLLARAIGTALSRSPVELTPALAPDGHAVIGKVEIERGATGLDGVKLAWVVTDADGKQIGVIDQNNTVPGGSLDKTWGAVAMPIAEGAAEGIVVLLKDAEKRRRKALRQAPNGDPDSTPDSIPAGPTNGSTNRSIPGSNTGRS